MLLGVWIGIFWTGISSLWDGNGSPMCEIPDIGRVQNLILQSGRCRDHSKKCMSRSRSRYDGIIQNRITLAVRAALLRGISQADPALKDLVANLARLHACTMPVENIISEVARYTRVQLLDHTFWSRSRYVNGKRRREGGHDGLKRPPNSPVIPDGWQFKETLEILPYDPKRIPRVNDAEAAKCAKMYLKSINGCLREHWPSFTGEWLQIPSPLREHHRLTDAHAEFVYYALREIC